MNVYFDNAATTALDETVFASMLPFLKENFGNPSSTHAHGRSTRAAIEHARKTIAGLLNASPEEIVFTSGGTEADNTAIFNAIRGKSIKHAITSKLEHHAVLKTLKFLESNGEISLSYVRNDEHGNLDLNHLEYLLDNNDRSFLSMMHGNNEVGNINDIQTIGELCKQHKAVFHSDTVQTMGHYPIDVSELNVDFLVGSAHKFHGPKGIGFLYARKSNRLSPLIFGGSQERQLRAGTENVPAIVGMAEALKLAYRNLEHDAKGIKDVKRCCIDEIKALIPEATFNGQSGNLSNSLYTVLSIAFPATTNNLLAELDYNGISASGGSACNSQHHSSHVLDALGCDPRKQNIRLSFSRYNSLHEVDFLIKQLSLVFSEPITA